MSNAAFLDVLRQYANWAQKRHVSYADAVHQFAAARAATIAKEEMTPERRAQALAKMQGALAREYQIWDEAFELRSYD